MAYYGRLNIWSNGKFGQILVFGEVGDMAGELNLAPIFTPNGCVFCTSIPDEFADQQGLLVRFEDEANRVPGSGKDDRIVIQGTMQPFGYRVVPASRAAWDHTPPSLDLGIPGLDLPSRQQVVLETEWNDTPVLVGPWICEGNAWKPKEPRLFAWDVSMGSWVNCFAEIRFVPKIPPAAWNLDVSDASQLLSWWRKRMIGIDKYKAFFGRFDREYPGWTNELKDTLSALDPQKTDLDKHRFEKAIRLFGVMDWQGEEWNRVLSSEAGQTALRECIGSRVDELERDCRAELDGRLHELEEKLLHAEAELSDKSSKIVDFDRKIEALREASEHLAGERSRLIKDAEFWRDLLGTGSVSDRPRSDHPPVPEKAETISPPPLERFAPASLDQPIDMTVSDFVTQRLLPRLKANDFRVRTSDAEDFHAALSVCRAVRVSHPGWTRAYAQALGSSAFVCPMVPSPRWGSFRDAWTDELGEIWRMAENHREYLVLAHIKELSLSFPDAWMHPLLDLLAGHESCLPVGGRPTWPDNLRLCWSDAGNVERDRFAIPGAVAAHFPTIRATLDKANVPSPEVAPEGHIPVSTWLSWRPSADPSLRREAYEAVIRETESFSPEWPACMVDDVANIALALHAINDKDEYTADDLRQRAVKLRCPLSDMAVEDGEAHADATR